jgi:hypothetical protein
MSENALFRNRILPHAVEEDGTTWEHQNIIEASFFRVTNAVRGACREILRARKITLNPLLTTSSLLDAGTNFLIIFLFLLLVSAVLFIPPYVLMPGTADNRMVVVSEFLFLILAASVLWTGYVYLFREFRKLVKDEAYPLFEKRGSELSRHLMWLVNGKYFRWQSGRGVRIFLTTILSVLLFVLYFSEMYNIVVPPFFVLFENSADPAYLVLSLMSFALLGFLMVFLIFLVCSVEVLVISVYLVLLGTTLDPSWEINPLVEMGGTENAGKIVMHCLFLFTFSVAIYPIITVLPQLENKLAQLSQLHLQSINDIASMSSTFYTSLGNIPFSVLTRYYGPIQQVLTVVGFAIVVLVVIHFRIKQRKKEELNALRQELSRYSPTDRENMAKIQHLLFLSDRVANLSEWPVNGKNFIIGILMSAVILAVSHIFL